MPTLASATTLLAIIFITAVQAFDWNNPEYSQTFHLRTMEIEKLLNNKESVLHTSWFLEDTQKRETTQNGVDWRTSGLLREPENQGSCGSCYAFSGTHYFQDNWNIEKGAVQQRLSIQQVLECCADCGVAQCENYCDGGYPSKVATYLTKFKAPNSNCRAYTGKYDSMQYTSKNKKCRDTCDDNSPWQLLPAITNLPTVKSNGVAAIKNALQKGPVLSSFKVPNDFQNYFKARPTGIYPVGIQSANSTTCSSPIGGHAIEIVGWSPGSPEHWIIKNSWGTNFADKGYYRFVSGWDLCGIESGAIMINKGLPQLSLEETGTTSDAYSLSTNYTQDVKAFLLSKLPNLVCNDSNYTISDIIDIDISVVSGVKYDVYFDLNNGVDSCDELFMQGIVVMSNDGIFNLLSLTNITTEDSNIIRITNSSTDITGIPYPTFIAVVISLIVIILVLVGAVIGILVKQQQEKIPDNSYYMKVI